MQNKTRRKYNILIATNDYYVKFYALSLLSIEYNAYSKFFKYNILADHKIYIPLGNSIILKVFIWEIR